MLGTPCGGLSGRHHLSAGPVADALGSVLGPRLSLLLFARNRGQPLGTRQLLRRLLDIRRRIIAEESPFAVVGLQIRQQSLYQRVAGFPAVCSRRTPARRLLRYFWKMRTSCALATSPCPGTQVAGAYDFFIASSDSIQGLVEASIRLGMWSFHNISPQNTARASGIQTTESPPGVPGSIAHGCGASLGKDPHGRHRSQSAA